MNASAYSRLRNGDWTLQKTRRTTIPSLAADLEKPGKEEGLPWRPDIRAGIMGGFIAMVVALTIFPFGWPTALIALGAGALIVGGLSRLERSSDKKKG